jgi:hypothetical protein
MPVMITDPDAFDRICAVEGDEYRNAPQDGNYRLPAFKAEWDAAVAYAAEAGCSVEDVLVEGVVVDSNAAIYGAGGYHRYFVWNTGEIVFSRFHATPEGCARAKAAGFRVVPDISG